MRKVYSLNTIITLANCFLPRSGMRTTLFVLKIYLQGLKESFKGN